MSDTRATIVALAAEEHGPNRSSLVKSVEYIPALDGLRTLAVGMVILFHLHIPGMALGWAGVLVFFAISGFLITTILLVRKQNATSFSEFYRDFMKRRALRIFPLYYAYLILCTLWSFLFSIPFSDQWSYWFYLQNYTLGLNKFYGSFTMGHTWSLALEEQFYFIWPLVVWRCSRETIKKLCWILVLLGPFARWAIDRWTDNPILAITTLPSCVDLFAMGALLALWGTSDRNGPNQKIATLSAAIAVVFLAVAFPYSSYWSPSLYIPQAMGPLVFSAVGLCSVYLLAVALRCNLFSRFLSTSPMTYMGKRSYGIYMFHGFIIIQFAEALPVVFGYLAWCGFVIVLSVALAAFSYNYFESFFLKLKDAW